MLPAVASAALPLSDPVTHPNPTLQVQCHAQGELPGPSEALVSCDGLWSAESVLPPVPHVNAAVHSTPHATLPDALGNAFPFPPEPPCPLPEATLAAGVDLDTSSADSDEASHPPGSSCNSWVRLGDSLPLFGADSQVGVQFGSQHSESQADFHSMLLASSSALVHDRESNTPKFPWEEGDIVQSRRCKGAASKDKGFKVERDDPLRLQDVLALHRMLANADEAGTALAAMYMRARWSDFQRADTGFVDGDGDVRFSVSFLCLCTRPPIPVSLGGNLSHWLVPRLV